MAAIRGCFEIPEDVTIEILARLPVNSLLRFKCVCKSWYALMKNPIFISKHLNYAPSNHDNARIIVIILKYRNTGGACVSFSSNVARKLSQEVTIPFFGTTNSTTNNELTNILFYGPCNGIICVHGKTYSGNLFGKHHQIALWNPATREIKHVPWKDNYEKFSVRVGFGFDRKSNDYKVIRIIDFRPDKSLGSVEAEDRLVEVYRTSTNCWSKLDVVLPKMYYIGLESSTYSNGLYYSHAISDEFVFSFDFADEVFETIPSPLDNLQFVKLLNFDETIALVGERIEDEFEPILDVEVWVLNMKGDGAKKTWTKFYKIPFLNVVGFLRGGEALVAVKDSLASYDPNTKHELCGELSFIQWSLCASPNRHPGNT